jgi:hypothetical protein
MYVIYNNVTIYYNVTQKQHHQQKTTYGNTIQYNTK